MNGSDAAVLLAVVALDQVGGLVEDFSHAVVDAAAPRTCKLYFNGHLLFFFPERSRS